MPDQQKSYSDVLQRAVSNQRWLICTTLFLLVSLGGSLAMASDSDDDGNGTTTAAVGSEAGSARELLDRRTATSNTFVFSDGSRETVVFQSPVYYRAENGSWKPINEDLQEQPDGSGLTNGANSFDLSLPERMGNGPVRLDAEEGWVSSRASRIRDGPRNGGRHRGYL